MPTIQQLVRKGRDIMKSPSKSRALDSCPQKRGAKQFGNGHGGPR